MFVFGWQGFIPLRGQGLIECSAGSTLRDTEDLFDMFCAPTTTGHDGSGGSDVSLRCLSKDLVVRRQVGNGPFQTRDHQLELLETFHLVDPQIPILVTPPVECLIRDSGLATCLGYCLPLGQSRLCFP